MPERTVLERPKRTLPVAWLDAGETRSSAEAGEGLAYEEDAWYSPDPTVDSAPLLKIYLLKRKVVASHSANPLADDEDAWARP